MDRFETGEEVWLTLARCYGWIVERYDEDHWVVEVDGDDIPVHEDDLVPASEAPAGAEAPPEPVPPLAPRPEATAGGGPSPAGGPAFTPLAEPGLHLLLVPSEAGELMGRRLLVNRTAHAFAVVVEGLAGGPRQGNLAAGERWALGTWDGDTVQGRPLTVRTWRLRDDGGTDHAFTREVRVKAAVLARKLAAWKAAANPRPEGLVWTLFADLPPKPPARLEVPLPEGLAARRAARRDRDGAGPLGHGWTDAPLPAGSGPNALAFANFPTDIDLHAERLIKDPSRLDAAAILAIQLDRARAYLERAAALGLPRVYLIHGVGKGRLRAELDALLRRHPHVKGHHHGYFAKYGFGATEVELGD